MEEKRQDIVFLKDIEKVDLMKKESSNSDESWKKDIYGFECGNWTCKC